MNKCRFKYLLTRTYQASSVGWALNPWSSDDQDKLPWWQLLFAVAKTFDANIDNICVDCENLDCLMTLADDTRKVTELITHTQLSHVVISHIMVL